MKKNALGSYSDNHLARFETNSEDTESPSARRLPVLETHSHSHSTPVRQPSPERPFAGYLKRYETKPRRDLIVPDTLERGVSPGPYDKKNKVSLRSLAEQQRQQRHFEEMESKPIDPIASELPLQKEHTLTINTTGSGVSRHVSLSFANSPVTLKKPVYEYFDQNAPEIKAIKESRETKDTILQWLSYLFGVDKSTAMTLEPIRNMYRIQKTVEREESEPKQNLLQRLIWYGLNIKSFKRAFKRFYKSEKRIIVFSFFYLLVDLIYCMMYLAEVQYHQSFGGKILAEINSDPYNDWLYVGRDPTLFSIAASIAAINLVALGLKLVFADNLKLAFFSMDTILDLIISLPLVVLTRIPNDIPYFLRALILVPNLKSVLRLRSYVPSLNFSNFREKTIILSATMIVILYMGMCTFSYAETRFVYYRRIYPYSGNADSLTLIDLLYYIVITTSTVGGEIAIVLMILVSLVLIPGLVTDLQDNYRLQQSGSGTYTRGTRPYVVVCGEFRNPGRVQDVINAIFRRDFDSRNKIVFLGRNKITSEIKELLSQPAYRNRAVYLSGSGLNVDDMKRVQLRHAAAAFILASGTAEDKKTEDEQNTLRAWAFDDFASTTPLYVDSLLPETEMLHEKTTTATVCVEELKQILMAYNCLYRGVGALLINLLQLSKQYGDYGDPWRAQYGDGTLNEIHQTSMNPVFVGHAFTHISAYILKEFQAVLFGLLIYIPSIDTYHVVLNPGPTYKIAEKDRCLLISASEEDIQIMQELSEQHFRKTFDTSHSPESEKPVTLPKRAESFLNLASGVQAPPAFGEDLVYGYPVHSYSDEKIPLCLLLTRPLTDVTQALIENASKLYINGHILICTSTFDMFRFICTLRSAGLTSLELKPIVFLCPHVPSEDEFKHYAVFPKIFFMVGDPQSRKDLERANIVGCHKVVIMNMYRRANNQDTSGPAGEFADSSAIMVASLIYNMFQRSGNRKYIVMELQRRPNIRFLRPTARKKRGKRRRMATRDRLTNEIVERNWDDDVYFSPVFAGGRVLTSSMLESILFQAYHNPFILDIFNVFCGVRYKRDLEMDSTLPFEKSALCYVSLPTEFIGRPFGKLYESLAISVGIIAIGLLRDEIDFNLGNKLPFVITNPPFSLLLKATDLVYVLATNSALS